MQRSLQRVILAAIAWVTKVNIARGILTKRCPFMSHSFCPLSRSHNRSLPNLSMISCCVTVFLMVRWCHAVVQFPRGAVVSRGGANWEEESRESRSMISSCDYMYCQPHCHHLSPFPVITHLPDICHPLLALPHNKVVWQNGAVVLKKNRRRESNHALCYSTRRDRSQQPVIGRGGIRGRAKQRLMQFGWLRPSKLH